MANNKITKSHLRNFHNGISTYTIEIDWMPFDISSGWGNGYINIQPNNPFYKLIQEQFSDSFRDIPINVTYNWMNESYPIEGQEWTFSKKEDDDSYTFGFDSLHGWNNMENSSEEIVVRQIEDFAGAITV